MYNKLLIFRKVLVDNDNLTKTGTKSFTNKKNPANARFFLLVLNKVNIRLR
jgi:hypothetical protein